MFFFSVAVVFTSTSVVVLLLFSHTAAAASATLQRNFLPFVVAHIFFFLCVFFSSADTAPMVKISSAAVC